MADKTTIIKAGSAGSSVLPAIAIIGAAYLGYKAVTGIGAGIQGTATGITERISDTVSNTIESVSKTTNRIIETSKEGGEVILDTSGAVLTSLNPLSTPKDPVDKHAKVATQTGLFTANSGLMGAGIGLSVGNVFRKNAIEKGLIKTPSSSSTKVSTLTSKDILSNGLSMAPIAQNTNSAIASDIGRKTTTKTPTAGTGIKIGDKVGTVTVTEVIKVPSSSSSKTRTAATGTGDNKISEFKSKYA